MFGLGDLIVHYTNTPVFFEFLQDDAIKLPAWFSPMSLSVEVAKRLGTNYHSYPKGYTRGLVYRLKDVPKFKLIENLFTEVVFLQEEKVLPSDLSTIHGRSSIIDRFPKYTKEVVDYYRSKGYNGVFEMYDVKSYQSVCVFENIVEFIDVINQTDFYSDMMTTIYLDADFSMMRDKYFSLLINYKLSNRKTRHYNKTKMEQILRF